MKRRHLVFPLIALVGILFFANKRQRQAEPSLRGFASEAEGASRLKRPPTEQGPLPAGNVATVGESLPEVGPFTKDFKGVPPEEARPDRLASHHVVATYSLLTQVLRRREERLAQDDPNDFEKPAFDTPMEGTFSIQRQGETVQMRILYSRGEFRPDDGQVRACGEGLLFANGSLVTNFFVTTCDLRAEGIPNSTWEFSNPAVLYAEGIVTGFVLGIERPVGGLTQGRGEILFEGEREDWQSVNIRWVPVPPEQPQK